MTVDQKTDVILQKKAYASCTLWNQDTSSCTFQMIGRETSCRHILASTVAVP
jgi:hypothetical protein